MDGSGSGFFYWTCGITTRPPIMKTKEHNLLLPGYDPFESAGECWFDPEAAENALGFFRDELVLIEGKCAGQPFELQPWQAAIVANLFGWKRPDGTRRYRESFIFVPRKNGKTPFCAGIINYVAFCDGEPGAQIYSSAGEREQAALVFRHASGMIARNPKLSKHSRVYRTFKSIEIGTSTIYKALSADSDTKHGLNAHLIINDELHVQPNRDLIDTLETATASRTQPLIIHITTAGFDKHSICFEKYDYAKKVRDGIIDNPYFLPVIFEASEEDDWTSEETWVKANPNLGVSVEIDYLRQACKEAQEIPAKENTFKRLHLNLWTKQDVRWLSKDVWDQCYDAFVESDLTGHPCYAGIDLSSTTDLSCISLYYPNTNNVLCYPFAPKDNAKRRSDRDRVPYMDWAMQGYLHLTGGDVVDYDFIRSFLNGLADKFKIKAVTIDRWNSVQITTQLTDDGFNVIPMGQGYASMTAPTKELEKLILERALNHNHHPVLDWCVSNVSVEQDAAGNLKPSKKKSTERIDCVVALINAIAGYLANPVKTSVYESRGALLL